MNISQIYGSIMSRNIEISSVFEDAKTLASPNHTFDDAQRSVLVKYSPSSSVKIAQIAVKAAHKPKDPSLLKKEKFFQWVIQASGFALRIDDGKMKDKVGESIFFLSLQLYLGWLTSFPFSCEEEVKEHYVRLFFTHISQIFVNPSYKYFKNDFIKRIQSILVESKPMYSQETWSVSIKVLFCGILDLNSINENISELSIIALDCLSSCNYYLDEFWVQFDDLFNELFKLDIFRKALLNKFRDLYQIMLEKRSIPTEDCDMTNLVQILNFFRKKINSFCNADQQIAFSNVVYSWKKCTDKKSGLVYTRWKTDEIKEQFLQWFSMTTEWKRDDTQMHHPIFFLIMMGEKESTPDLHNIAYKIIINSMKLPKEEQGDIYWYLPQYSYYFLGQNREILDDIKEDFISYVCQFKNSNYEKDTSLCVHIIYILMLLLERHPNDEKLQKAFSEFVMWTKNNFVVAITLLVSLIFINNSELYWSHVNKWVRYTNIGDVIDTIALISGFSPHLNGNKFADYATIDGNIWEYLISASSVHQQQRLLLSFTFLSEGSDYFLVNIDDGVRLLEYVSRPQTAASPRSFINMARLSIISGSGQMEMNDNLKSKKSIENYITENYIVSVFDDSHLLIRHGLGNTAFEVKDLNGRTIRQPPVDVEDVMKPTVIPEPSDYYQSEMEQDAELMDAVEQMNEIFSSNSEFEQYSKPMNQTGVSAAHSLLCDIGFISVHSDKKVKRVPQAEMANAIERGLDQKVPSPIIRIPILQIIDSKMQNGDTKAFKNLLDDLEEIQTKICRFSFEQSDELAANYGFLVLLNETQNMLNLSCKDLYHNVIVALTPLGDSHYYVNLLNKTETLIGKHKTNDFNFAMQRKNIAKLVSIVALLYYTSQTQFAEKMSSGAAAEEQSKGPECFVSGFISRLNIIKTIYDRNIDEGKTPLLREFTHDSR